MLKQWMVTAFLFHAIASSASAAEIGDMTLYSSSNEPLNASIAVEGLTSVNAPRLQVKLGSLLDFYRHEITAHRYIYDLTLSLLKEHDGNAVIKLTSRQPLNAQELALVVKLYVNDRKRYGVFQVPLPVSEQPDGRFLVAENRIRSSAINTYRDRGLLVADQYKAAEKTSLVNRLMAKTTVHQEEEADSGVNLVDLTANKSSVSTVEVATTVMVDGTSYQVKSGDSISAIAMRLLPNYPAFKDWQALMHEIVKYNADAFTNADINRLRVSAVLSLPEKSPAALSLPVRADSESANTVQTMFAMAPTASNEENEEHYQVKSGDSISAIAMRLLPEYPTFKDWRTLMDTMVERNPNAFTKADINQLKVSAVLSLPEKSQVTLSTQVEERTDRAGTVTVTLINDMRYQVQAGDSISAIAMRLLPKYPEFKHWGTLMGKMIDLNPQAFIDGNIDLLRTDVALFLPKRSEPYLAQLVENRS